MDPIDAVFTFGLLFTLLVFGMGLAASAVRRTRGWPNRFACVLFAMHFYPFMFWAPFLLMR